MMSLRCRGALDSSGAARGGPAALLCAPSGLAQASKGWAAGGAQRQPIATLAALGTLKRCNSRLVRTAWARRTTGRIFSRGTTPLRLSTGPVPAAPLALGLGWRQSSPRENCALAQVHGCGNARPVPRRHRGGRGRQGQQHAAVEGADSAATRPGRRDIAAKRAKSDPPLALDSRRDWAKGSRELSRSRGKSAEQLHSCTRPAELVPARSALRTRRPG